MSYNVHPKLVFFVFFASVTLRHFTYLQRGARVAEYLGGVGQPVVPLPPGDARRRVSRRRLALQSHRRARPDLDAAVRRLQLERRRNWNGREEQEKNFSYSCGI